MLFGIEHHVLDLNGNFFDIPITELLNDEVYCHYSKKKKMKYKCYNGYKEKN